MSVLKFYEWSKREYGHLPWRKKRTIYRTFVSEIMLQQTTVSTVLKHFESFLRAFPNLISLSQSTEEEVCAQWQGLGYYRRARNLRKAALFFRDHHGGSFPQTFEELIKAPGIGQYTASALMAIGRNNEALAIDANLERVLSRLYLLSENKGTKLQGSIYQREGEIKRDFQVRKYGGRALNEALMDLGRVYCQAKKADCFLCPLKKKCLVYLKKMNPLEYPRSHGRKRELLALDLLRIIVKKRDSSLGTQVLGYQRGEGKWLSGQIEIPTFILKSEDPKISQYPWLLSKRRFQGDVFKSSITKYKITNTVIEMSWREFSFLVKEVKEMKGEGDFSEDFHFYYLDENIHFSTSTLKSLRAHFQDLKNQV